MVGWKKVHSPLSWHGANTPDVPYQYDKAYIVKLTIPDEALVRFTTAEPHPRTGKPSNLIKPAGLVPKTARGKMRASIAEVEQIQRLKSRSAKRPVEASTRVGISGWDDDFIYLEGQLVRPRLAFDRNRSKICGSGIHFYATREEAEAHNL